MFTTIDKALVATVMVIVYWFNLLTNGGLDAGTISGVIEPIAVSIIPVLVWLFPNKGFQPENS